MLTVITQTAEDNIFLTVFLWVVCESFVKSWSSKLGFCMAHLDRLNLICLCRTVGTYLHIVEQDVFRNKT